MTFSRKSSRRAYTSRRTKILVVVLIIIAALNIFNISFISPVTHALLRPVSSVTQKAYGSIDAFRSLFSSKKELHNKVKTLQMKVDELESVELSYSALSNTYIDLLEEFNRPDRKVDEVVAHVLHRPPASLYDTLIIDVGREIVSKGDVVMVYGIPVGYILDVHSSTAVVELLSSSKKKTEGLLGTTTAIDLVGMGGGQYESLLPKNVEVKIGDPITSSEFPGAAIGSVQEVISSDVESFQTIYSHLPFSLYNIRIVTVLSSNTVNKEYAEDSIE